MSVIDPCRLPTDPSPLSVSMTEAQADTYLTTCSDRTSKAFSASVSVAGRTATVLFANSLGVPGEILVAWGDGAISDHQAMSLVSAVHTYARDGVYEITVSAAPAWNPVPFKTAPPKQALGLQAVVNWPPAPGTPLAQPAFTAAHPPL
jgi:hypothetical protein